MIAVKYIIFAGISTIVNLSSQFLSLKIYAGTYSLYIAIFWGTLFGLVTKYILDKRYIFYYITKNKLDDSIKFILYTSMGVITTLIFWSFEISFNYIFDFKLAKYLGAVTGLSIGYLIKYKLDKKYVFKG
ncbi:GtrA family protein [Limisalsivibrio acetivorans]|uniref:GtrA family protein n=1 Tax=Limisalsivibrio acetivorans TaxID=1304888 RepID=UPI0003B354E9|nr:GtrA family protein [Limisalsivibrio acetivorans]